MRVRLAAILAAAALAFAAAPAAADGALREGGARRLATKITIAVEDAGVRYRFTAAVLSTAPLQFEWFTTSPVAAEGVRVQSQAALDRSHRYCECYANREWGDAGDATALWLSREVVDELGRAGVTALVFNEDSRTMAATHLHLVRRDRFALAVDGAPGEVRALVARTDAGTELWIRDDPGDPLVLSVAGQWSMRVTDIRQRPDDDIQGFVTVDGLAMHYVMLGSGPPLFVVHGGPGMEHGYFRPYLDALAAQFTVVYVDQQGQGLSERLPPGRPYTMAGAVAALDGLRAALGFERIVLLGHSYGGFVAQLYALAHQDRLAALILADTAPSIAWNAEASANIQRFGTPEQRNPPPGLSDDERARLLFPLYFDPPEPGIGDRIMDPMIRSGEAWRQLTGGREFRTYDVRAALPSIRVPTLVLVGDHDLITTPNQSAIIAAGIPGADLHVFPATGHNGFVEDPGMFNAEVARFGLAHAQR